jgi:hypothetical protein
MARAIRGFNVGDIARAAARARRAQVAAVLLTLGRQSGPIPPSSASTDGGFRDREKQLCVLLQRLEFRLEPNLCDEGGHHSTADYGRQQDGVLSLIDDVIGQTKQCRDRTEG